MRHLDTQPRRSRDDESMLGFEHSVFWSEGESYRRRATGEESQRSGIVRVTMRYMILVHVASPFALPCTLHSRLGVISFFPTFLYQAGIGILAQLTFWIRGYGAYRNTFLDPIHAMLRMAGSRMKRVGEHSITVGWAWDRFWNRCSGSFRM
jgi:hypothetical protein